jgi:hypothetical protein
VKWYLQVCNGATQVATRKLNSPVKSKDFDEEISPCSLSPWASSPNSGRES